MAPIGSKQHEMKKWTKHHWLVVVAVVEPTPWKNMFVNGDHHPMPIVENTTWEFLCFIGLESRWFKADFSGKSRLTDFNIRGSCMFLYFSNVVGQQSPEPICRVSTIDRSGNLSFQPTKCIKNRVHPSLPPKKNLKKINNCFDFVSLKKLNMIKLSLKLPPQSIAAIARLQAEAAEPIAANAGGTRGELQHLAAQPRPGRWGMEDLDLNVETLGKVRYFFLPESSEICLICKIWWMDFVWILLYQSISRAKISPPKQIKTIQHGDWTINNRKFNGLVLFTMWSSDDEHDDDYW